MIKKYLLICVYLFAVANLAGQSSFRRVKQPPRVMQAFKVCTDFRNMLAKDLNFDRAFEATFVKDPARRRAIAIADTQFSADDLAQIDDATVIGLYKDATQLYILILPVVFLVSDEQKAELLTPSIQAIFDRTPPKDPGKIREFAAQLKRDVDEVRTHIDKVAARNPTVAKTFQGYKTNFSKRIELPNRVVKPLTAYSKGHVLRVEEPYYQIDDCALIREDGKMRLIGYTFLRMRG